MNRVALVTGAGSGVGRHSALALALDGFQVILSGRREDPLQETAQLATEAGCSTHVLTVDVSDESSVDALFEQIEKRYGRLDVLFNNAGINVPPTELDELAPDDWNRMVATNLTGVFLCCRAAMRLMKRQDPQGGRIINNGSVSAQVPRPLSAAYTATKHAINGLTKSIALDGRPYRIACGQIDIGNALTEMSAGIQQGALQANGDRVPEPMMNVVDVADAVAYMAGLPLEANVPFITVMATNMPLLGRG